MHQVASIVSALILASGSAAQGVPQAAADPVAIDGSETVRLNAEADAQASAQSATIRQSQQDYARAQASFASAQAAYEDAKRRNDAERAAAAASAEAYRRDLSAWKTTVAEVAARNARLSRVAHPPAAAPAKEVTVVARTPARIVCAVERETGTIIPRRVCRSQAQIAEERAAGAVQVQAIRDDMNSGGAGQP